MINYINEMIETINIQDVALKEMAGFSCIGGKVIVVNNYIKILTFSTSKVVLKVKADELIIEGRDISIKELNKNDISLKGNIARVYYAGEVRNIDKAK